MFGYGFMGKRERAREDSSRKALEGLLHSKLRDDPNETHQTAAQLENKSPTLALEKKNI